MCGIVYVQRKDNKSAVRQALKRYQAQKGRGSEGFGYVAVKQSGNVTDSHRFMFEHEMITSLNKTKHQHLLVHHRFPTSTPNVPESAHPIKVSHKELQYDYIVTHNGVLQNDEELKEKHNKLGYPYTTELQCTYTTPKHKIYSAGAQWNDSEALAIELARNIEGLIERVEARGTIAYLVLQVEKTTGKAIALYYGTNGGNPLCLTVNKDYIVIASEGGKAINDNVCYRMSLPDNTVTEYSQVQVPTYYTRPATGFAGHTSGMYSGYGTSWSSKDDKYDYLGLPKKSKKHNASIRELEDELGTVEDEIIGLGGDIAFATAEGDMEEAEKYQAELADLILQRDKIQELYARKGNA